MLTSLLLALLGFFFAGCSAPTIKNEPDSDLATLITSSEKTMTNLGEVKFSLQFEHIDGELFGNALWGGSGRYRVTPGHRNCGVYIHRSKSKYSSSLYGQGIIRANLRAGRTYRITGKYDNGFGSYAIVDTESGEIVSDFVEVSFAVIRPTSTIPLIIPLK